jgi:hypothetical protein
MNSFLKFWSYIFFHFNIVMSNEFIQSVTYDNSDDFQHVNFIFFIKFHFTILKIIV